MSKLQALFGFALHVAKRVTDCEKVCNQVMAAVSRERHVADFIRGVEGAADEIAASSHMLAPWNQQIAKRHQCASFEAIQPALFN